MSNSVTVKICGEEFKLITENSMEYTQAVGMHVNAEMQKMLATRMGRMDAAIMAALNIADDLFKVRLTDEQLRAQIKSALDAEASAKSETNALKRDNLSLQKKLDKAEKELAKMQKALSKVQKALPKSVEEPADTPAPLDEAAMAEIVEKSKRRKTTRKTKAEAVKVEAVEEVAEPEAVAENAQAVPEASESAEAVPEAVEAVTEAPESVEAVPESVDAAPEAPKSVEAVAETPEAAPEAEEAAAEGE